MPGAECERTPVVPALLVGLSLALASTGISSPFSAPAQALISVMLVALAFRSRAALLPFAYLWWFPAFLSLTLGGLYAGVNQGYAMIVVAVTLGLAVFSTGVAGNCASERSRDSVVWAAATSGLVMGVVVVAQAGVGPTLDAVFRQTFRLGWEVGQPNMAGQVAAISALVLFSGVSRARMVSVRLGLGTAAAAMALLAFGTQSRRALFLMVVGLVVLLIIARSRWLALSAALPIAAFALAITRGGDLKRLDSLAALFSGDADQVTGSDALRADLVDAGWERFGVAPLFGSGTGTLRFSNESSFGSVVSSHNTFVELLAGNGVVGFLAFYVPLALILVAVAQHAWRTRSSHAALITALLASNLIVSSAASITFLDRFSMLIYGVAAAAAYEYSAARSAAKRKSQRDLQLTAPSGA